MPIGADAINPVNGARIPIFVADYVLGSTAPARSWPSPRTTSATSRSRPSTACRSARDHARDGDPDEVLTEAFVNKAVDEAPADDRKHGWPRSR